ncbi:9730_t:CDS:2, partial [Racocetra fulgida]
MCGMTDLFELTDDYNEQYNSDGKIFVQRVIEKLLVPHKEFQGM